MTGKSEAILKDRCSNFDTIFKVIIDNAKLYKKKADFPAESRQEITLSMIMTRPLQRQFFYLFTSKSQPSHWCSLPPPKHFLLHWIDCVMEGGLALAFIGFAIRG